jgi:hypothetical protein
VPTQDMPSIHMAQMQTPEARVPSWGLRFLKAFVPRKNANPGTPLCYLGGWVAPPEAASHLALTHILPPTSLPVPVPMR